MGTSVAIMTEGRLRANGAFSGEEIQAPSPEYTIVEQALGFVAENVSHQPSLGEIAAHVGLSEAHFQRMFTVWAGVSPKRFLQYITLDAAKERLARSVSVLDTAIDVGLSSAGRLHDLFVTYEAVTPGEFKRRGEGIEIRHGFGTTPFGEAMVMQTERGICGLQFAGPAGREELEESMTVGWERAVFVRDELLARQTLRSVFAPAAGDASLTVLARGTPFQLKVWEALLRVPLGFLVTYERLAEAGTANGGTAVRAAAGAIACNPIAYLIPCHRVIRKTALLGGYRWGLGRKLALIGTEAARSGCTGS
jgi:AraC family transcriptional regulator of adaptative response/methylated-DNA-[protein]-cysteine methyltransferase